MNVLDMIRDFVDSEWPGHLVQLAMFGLAFYFLYTATNSVKAVHPELVDPLGRLVFGVLLVSLMRSSRRKR